jgi:endonuclease YncB( thermonuclease family)
VVPSAAVAAAARLSAPAVAPAAAPAAPSAAAQSPAVQRTAARAAVPVAAQAPAAAAAPAPAPAAWPPPGALPAEELERRTSPPAPAPQGAAATATVPGAHVAPGTAAATVQPVAAPTPTERVSRRRILTRGPELTLTRIAIILLAALLGFSALSNMARSNSSASHPPSPASGIDASPLTGESPGASGPVAPSTGAQPAFQPSATTQFATVTSVTDGDTIKVEIDGKEYRVRYIGMDAPEPDATDPAIKRIADAATAANSGIVAGKDVYLEREVSDTDRFGRLLRDVWLIDDGGSYVLVNVELVRLGYAQISTFPPDVRYVRELQAAQQQAQADGVGIWGIGKSISPEVPVAPGASGVAGAGASPQGAVGPSGSANCHPSYDPCLPIVEDLDCAQVRAMGKAPVTVKGPDDYMLDAEEDGLGCEANE